MTLQGILLDLDNTLVDRGRSIETYSVRFLERFSAHLGRTSATAVAQAIDSADLAGYRPKDEVFEELSSALPWRSRPVVEEIAAHWQTAFSKCAEPMKGLDTALAGLADRGLRMGVVSNGTTVVQNEKIDTLGIRPHLDAVVISEAAGVRKPDERIFQIALAELGLKPAQAWFVGDNPIADVLGASAVGLTAVWMRGSFEWPAEHEQPELKIDSLDELLPLVDRHLG